MKKNILFLPASIRSHVIPAFYLANLLGSEYDIYFAVTSDALEALVTDQGFHAVRTGELRVGVGMEEQYVMEKYRRSSKWRTLKAVNRDELYHIRQRELSDIVDDIQPAAIFLDIANSTDILVLYPRYKHIRLLFLNATLSTYRVNGFPAVHEGEWLSPQLRQTLKNGIPAHYYLKNPLDAFIARSMESQFERFTSAGHFSDKHPVAADRTNTLMFEGFQEVIMAPLELEVSPGVRKPNQHYLGLCIPETHQDTGMDADFEQKFAEVLAQREAGKQLLYCTFAAGQEDTDESLLDFLNRLLDVIQSLPQVVAVLAVSQLGSQTVRYLNKLPDNVRLFTRVTQTRILEHSDLCITNGCLRSVKESIYYGVPMLVYPQEVKCDQNGNGLKVEYHGLGQRGIFGSEPREGMREKITELLGSEKYLRTISLFRKRVLDRYKEGAVSQSLHQLVRG